MFAEMGAAAGGKILAETTGLDMLNAGSSVLSAALSPVPSGPSRADSGVTSNVDHSGWTVNTGSGSASASPLSPWLVGLIAFGALLWYKKKS